MSKDKQRTIYIPFRIEKETDEILQALALATASSKSDVIRQLIHKGLKHEGYKNDDERLYQMIKKAVEEVTKPQTNRLASISAKATHMICGAFFMLVYLGKLILVDEDKHAIDHYAIHARELGVQYLKIKDESIDGFIKSGVKKVSDNFDES